MFIIIKKTFRCLQGTIASIFNDSTTLGRKYVFDIRRTCREVHDNARREAHAHAAFCHESRQRRRSSGGTDHKVRILSLYIKVVIIKNES